jgi:hypothetical protein
MIIDEKLRCSGLWALTALKGWGALSVSEQENTSAGEIKETLPRNVSSHLISVDWQSAVNLENLLQADLTLQLG